MQPYRPLGTLYAAAALACCRIFGGAVRHDAVESDEGFRRNRLREHNPRIVAIYEDDFNFLSKMCLTRMREVAWDIAEVDKQEACSGDCAWLRRDRSIQSFSQSRN